MQLDSVKQVTAQKEAIIKGHEAKISHLEKILISQKIEQGKQDGGLGLLKDQLRLKELEVQKLKTDKEVKVCNQFVDKIDQFIGRLETSHGFTYDCSSNSQL